MAKINSINNKSGSLEIDPGASGDSYVQFSINGTGEFRIGVDDDDGDAFKISQGSALGSNDCFVMSAAGECNLPLTPAFNVKGTDNGQALNVTGDGTSYQLYSVSSLLADEVFDQNSDFSIDTFTAPITGKYILFCALQIIGITPDHYAEFHVTTSNGTYQVKKNDLYFFSGGSSSIYSGKVFVDMDTSDTATINLIVSGGSKVIGIQSGTLSNGQPTFIQGKLIC